MKRTDHSRWVRTSLAVTLLIVVASTLTGFVWFPLAQSDSQFRAAWDAFCSAAGLVRSKTATGRVEGPSFKTSKVIVIPTMLREPDARSIGRGGTLALQCTMCHGARGVSDAKTPNLAGQFAAAIYKQLQDYKSGARVSAIMSPRVNALSDADMRDIAVFYAYLPRLAHFHPPGAAAAPQIVVNGAPMRNIPPCGACHGDLEYKAGSAWLEGVSSNYLRSQLEAFASGERHNDISGQMRNIARNLTPDEIEAAANYYGSRRP
jgi:cytochrome c553